MDNQQLKLKVSEAQAGQAKRQPPPNYYSRREQVRLLVLCGTLMLVLIMMNEARKPTTWDWLWAGETAEQEELEEPIDTRIDLHVTSLPTDGFKAQPNEGQSKVVNSATPRIPEITPELLATIKDNTVLRGKENDAWMAMLGALQNRSTDQIDSLSIGKVGFAQLFRQTDFYRGQFVTVSGTIRRLEAIQPKENSQGIEQLYRWILRPRGGAAAPMVVYSLEKPEAFRLSENLAKGAELREPCQFTGLYFKRWAYAAADGTRVAPLLLAKAPTWEPPTPAKAVEVPSLATSMLTLASLIALSTLVAIAVYRSSNVKRADIDRLRVPQRDLEELEQEDILPSPSEALRNLAQSGDEQAGV